MYGLKNFLLQGEGISDIHLWTFQCAKIFNFFRLQDRVGLGIEFHYNEMSNFDQFCFGEFFMNIGMNR